jgi:hypothetical protein
VRSPEEALAALLRWRRDDAHACCHQGGA